MSRPVVGTPGGAIGPIASKAASAAVALTAVVLLAPASQAAPDDPEEGGQWGAVIDWPHIAVSAANLPDGRVLTWSGSEREIWPSTEQTYSATWDPATGAFEEVFHPTHNMFCAHLAMLEDGRVFVNGGRNQTNSPWTSVFDYRDSQWVQVENMATGGRWYPTTLALADGNIFTAIGTASQPRYPEIWNPAAGWQIKNGIDFNDMVLDDYFSTNSHGESRWWPLLHVAPNGQIFHSGPTPKMHYIDPAGNGSYTQVGSEFTAWYHKHGTSVMYDEGKILTAGGWISGTNASSTNQAFTIDLNGPAPDVRLTAPMNFARKFQNGVMLPTGEVLVIGGNTSGQKFSDNGAILATEIWNPQTGQWRIGASMATPRNYHSIALLLTDGRVLAAGSGYCSGSVFCNGASHRDGEVYTPAYLFDPSGNLAARPAISNGPPRVSSGEEFVVTATPGLARFTMIKMSATTHGVNTDLRFLEVPFIEDSPGSYRLTANANPNVMTPGYWMLFALDAADVPSVAHVFQANSTGMPWLNAIADQASRIGDPVSVQIVAGDADGDPLVYSATGLPAGLSIDPNTGLISGAATISGTYTVDVSVTDNDEGSGARSFQWVVFGQGLGAIRRDVWTGIPGTSVADLTGLASYPDSPDSSDRITTFETPTNIADNYGTRVHGYLTPSVTGSYEFWLATDDFGELWLSTDADPANRVLIATVPGWASSRQWTKYPEQKSVPIDLVAGRSYFIEALQKEAGGGDNLAVGWRRPGDTGITVIAGAYLSETDVTIAAPAEAKLLAAVVPDVTASWTTVTLAESYDDMVVIATPRLTEASVPVVTRIRNAAGNSFELRVQNPGDLTQPGPTVVDYLVLEAGRYAGNGLTFEASRVTLSRVDENNSWIGNAANYSQSYAAPVVLGQVMTHNDPDFSVFWASDGTAAGAPSSSTLFVGRHVGEDTDVTRAAETIGYAVFESGTGSVAGLDIETGLGARTVGGITNAPPYEYTVGTVGITSAVASSAGMAGNNGGWPVLYGNAPFAAGALAFAIDEDQIGDSERAHTTERVAFVAISDDSVVELTLDPVDPMPAVTGTGVDFDVTATGGIDVVYNWNFGDGTGETGFGPASAVSHTYSGPGRYVVSVTARDNASGAEVTETFVQLIHAPVLAVKPQTSGGLVLHESQGQAWNVNPDNDTVSVIDTLSRTRLDEIAVGDHPVSVQVAPDGRIWVVNKGGASISVIDPTMMQVVSTLNLAAGSAPHGLVFVPELGSAYVALEATGELVQLDASSGAGQLSRYLGGNIRHVSVANDKILVSRFVTPTLPNEWTAAPIVESGGVQFGGEVLVVDARTMVQDGVVVLQHSNRGVSEHTGPGIPNYLGPAVVSPDGTAAWVPSKQDNILAGALRGGQGMTFDQTVRAVTSRIDLAGMAETFWARIDHDNASVASHAAFGPYGAYLFTALEGNREIVVSDAYTAIELMRFDTGRAPQALAVSGDGTALYAHNFMDRSVSIFDISRITGSNELEVTLEATVNTVASEALAADVLKGKQLFYDARDPRLALDSYMSCASCHNQGGHDGRIWDFTGLGEGLRNTTTLEGRAAIAHGFLHWSANFDEVQDFEGQIRNFAGGTGLMDDADFLAGTRSDPLGDPKTGLSPDLDALAAYLGSLTTFPASPHRNPDGTLTPEGEAGLALFHSHGCVDCHTPDRYTDSSVGNVHDIGTITAASGQRLGSTLDGIDTPTLISAWATGPFLHDGSAQDTEEAIEAHSAISLTASELASLGAYLEQLDGATAQLVPGGDPDCAGCIDFETAGIVSYSNQDFAGNYSTSDGGLSIELVNNTWKRTSTVYRIEADSVLEFDFESNAQGEIHAIGFDGDNTHSQSQLFRVYGTQAWGVGDFDTYSAGQGKVRFQIPVGRYYTGSAMSLALVNDFDAGSGNRSVFSNVRLIQGGNVAPVVSNPGTQVSSTGESVSRSISASDLNGDPITFSATGLPPGLTVSTAGVVSGTASAEGTFAVTINASDPAGAVGTVSFDWIVSAPGSCSDCVNLSAAGIDSYANQDAGGSYLLTGSGLGIDMQGNTWKRTSATFTVTVNTVLEFDFASDSQGEIHGIGLDEDNSLSSSRIFRLYGTQGWGIANYANYGGSGEAHFVIPVGQYYAGSAMALVLVNDKDSGSADNRTSFSNIRIYETP